MNQEELFQKVKEMIKNGNFDGAKRFIEEHKEQDLIKKSPKSFKRCKYRQCQNKFKNLFK